jgi:DNA adenine methylase
MSGKDPKSVDHLSLDYVELTARAGQTLSASPRPFLRWAGSKQRLLSQIVPLLPPAFNRYFEPFIGSGSLFFLLRPKRAILGDACEELICTYKAVRDDSPTVLRHLRRFNALDKKLYYRVRANRSQEPSRRAAEFIFLNRAGWNGLYRVNSRGEFNVPYGAPKTANLIDPDNLVRCSSLLRRRQVKLRTGDFEAALDGCQPGDFVFLDPPYVTSHNNNGFIDYNERLFSWADQVRLAEVARSLADRGAYVIVANAHHDPVLALYRDFFVTPVVRSSTLAGAASARRRVTESLICSFPSYRS